jgi:ectoine hydroxylase-related dioxygenase (phytanoyl-CoA dioxygenase family)
VRLDPVIEHSYREQGAALLKGAFTLPQLELLQAGIQRNIENPSKNSYHRFAGREAGGDFFYDYGCHRWIPEYVEFVKGSGLAAMAAELLSSQRICFFDDSYFVKQSGSELPAPWHHDFSYYEIEGEMLVAWVPIDPHGESETLRFVAGSHRWGKLFLPVPFDPREQAAPDTTTPPAYDPLPDIAGGDFEILAWAVEPGDCVFFNGLTLHSTRGNATIRDQRRFSGRFIDESAVYTPRAGYPLSDGKANANVEPGQRLCEDPENVPVVWDARATTR